MTFRSLFQSVRPVLGSYPLNPAPVRMHAPYPRQLGLVLQLCKTHFGQRPNSIVLDPRYQTRQLDEPDFRQESPRVPRRCQDSRVGGSTTVDCVSTEEAEPKDEMKVCDSFSTMRDLSFQFGLRVIVTWWGLFVDRTQDQGVVGHVVERRTDKHRWEEEAKCQRVFELMRLTSSRDKPMDWGYVAVAKLVDCCPSPAWSAPRQLH